MQQFQDWLYFKENRNGEAMNHKQLEKKCKEFINNPNFAYSLYYYLMNDHQINDNFSPVRYYGEDKKKIIERFTSVNKNSVEDWFTEKYEEIMKTRKSKDETYIYVEEKDANNNYRNWKLENLNRLHMKSIHDTMTINLKFEYKSMKSKGKVIKIYQMKEEDYNKLIAKLNNVDIDELEELNEENDVEM